MVAAPAKAGGNHRNIMLIMWEPLIMQELLISIMQEPKSGQSIQHRDYFGHLSIFLIRCVSTKKTESVKVQPKIC